MGNPYLKIDRIEFFVTFLCSGRCRHCSVAPWLRPKGRRFVDPEKAAAAVRALADGFGIRSFMTFGGEPLLFPEATCRLHRTASRCGIPERQIITNGYFSKKSGVIRETAAAIGEAGVNDVLISVDAFHQEKIPLESVRLFAEALLEQGVEGVRFHPAWVVHPSHPNPYNERTREILDSLSDMGIGVTEGNCIYPAGSAAKCLAEYYPKPAHPDLSRQCGEAPYTDRLDDVHTLSIDPDGKVHVCAFTIGDISTESVETIVEQYDPYRDPRMRALLEGGVKGLAAYAESRGTAVDAEDGYSACDICRKCVAALDAGSDASFSI